MNEFRLQLRAERSDVPVDIRLRGATLSAELPLFVRRTAFDAPPSRLHLVWEVTAA